MIEKGKTELSEIQDYHCLAGFFIEKKFFLKKKILKDC